MQFSYNSVYRFFLLKTILWETLYFVHASTDKMIMHRWCPVSVRLYSVSVTNHHQFILLTYFPGDWCTIQFKLIASASGGSVKLLRTRSPRCAVKSFSISEHAFTQATLCQPTVESLSGLAYIRVVMLRGLRDADAEVASSMSSSSSSPSLRSINRSINQSIRWHANE